MNAANARPSRAGWIHTLGAIGAILLPLALLVSFFTSADTGDTADEVITYAKDNESEVWLLQIMALVAPLLIGMFVASLRVQLRRERGLSGVDGDRRDPFRRVFRRRPDALGSAA